MKILGILITFCLVFALGTFAFGQETVKPADNSVKVPGKSVRETEKKAVEDEADKTAVVDTKDTQPDTAKTSDGQNDRYRIGYQDTLEIIIYRHPELSGAVNVNPDGTINLFRLEKPIIAVCKTENQLRNEIAAAYRENYLRDPYVNVRAVDQKSQSFAVLGSVEKPGTFYVNRRIRLLELLAFAGGPSKDAGQTLIVARTGSLSTCRDDSSATTGNDENVALLYYKISDITESKENLWMQPGDIVSVKDADVVYVVGNVNKPQEIKLKEPITLSQAIAAAQGTKSSTDKKNVRILRRKPDSFDREELSFNLQDIESQKVSDPVLEPNDIVAVSKDQQKVIVKGIFDIIKTGVPSLFYRF